MVRRVVTGHTASGTATFASDMNVEATKVALLPGVTFHRLWGADQIPSFPDDGSPPQAPDYFPRIGGFRFGLVTFLPDSKTPAAELDVEMAMAEVEEKLPGLMAHMEPDNPGMHTTASVDFEYIVSGEVWLELDDGQEVHLRAGDTVVQNGTRHAWRNKGSEPCRMVACLIGANRT